MNVPSPSRAARELAALTAACAVAAATAPSALALNADKYFYPNGSGVSTNTSPSQWFHLYLNDSADVSSSGAECVVTFNNGHAFGHKISGTTIKSSDKHLSLQNTFRWNTVTGSVSIGKGQHRGHHRALGQPAHRHHHRRVDNSRLGRPVLRRRQGNRDSHKCLSR